MNSQEHETDRLYAECESEFGRWEVIQDVIDESIDLMLNYRQSGHPGGSRSKVHAFVALALSGAMRWDIRKPWRPFCDRFVLSAGHTVPLIYAGLAVLNQTLRLRHARSGDERFAFPSNGQYALTWEDLLVLRRNKGGCPVTPRWKARRCSSSGTPAPPVTGCPRRPGKPWRSSVPAPARSRSLPWKGKAG